MSDLCRRTLLKGAAATCGAGLLAACGNGDAPAVQQPGSADTRAAEPPGGGGGGVRASLVALSEVPVGAAVMATAPDGTQVLVTQPTAGEVLGFSAVCPHEGCTVAPDDEQLTCPCHGSQFDLTGDVTRGPADRDLTPFPVRVEAGQVLPA